MTKYLQHITLADCKAWYDTCGQNNYRKTNKKAYIDKWKLTENENNDAKLLDDENSLTSVSPKNLIKKISQARIIQSV